MKTPHISSQLPPFCFIAAIHVPKLPINPLWLTALQAHIFSRFGLTRCLKIAHPVQKCKPQSIIALHKKPLIFFPFFHWMMKKGKKIIDVPLPLRRPIIKHSLKRHDSEILWEIEKRLLTISPVCLQTGCFLEQKGLYSDDLKSVLTDTGKDDTSEWRLYFLIP